MTITGKRKWGILCYASLTSASLQYNVSLECIYITMESWTDGIIKGT